MARASTSGSNENPNKNTSSSTYSKTVCLQDWWLIKVEKDFDGKKLAIGGLTSREQQAVRFFSSAPIVRRYDLFTLETADGITVMIKGSINRPRTLENGFPSEVCNHFLFGFPYYWEACADQCFEKEYTAGNAISGLSNKQDNLNHDCSNEQESVILEGNCFNKRSENVTGDASKDFVLEVNAKVVGPSDVELHTKGEISNKNKVGGTGVVFNSSKTNNRDYSAKKLTNYDNNALKDCSVAMGYGVKSVVSSNVSTGIPAGNSCACEVKIDGSVQTKGSLKGEGSINLRTCSYGTEKDDSLKDASAIGPDMKNDSQFKVNMVVPVNTSSNYLTTSNTLETPNSKQKYKKTKYRSMSKRTSCRSVSVSQDKEALMVSPVEEKLSHGISKILSNVGPEGLVAESFSMASQIEHPKDPERVGNWGYNMDTQNVTPITDGATLTSCMSKYLEGDGEKSSTTGSCARDENNESNSISGLDPNAKHLKRRSASKMTVLSCSKLDTSKEIMSPSGARRSSSRLKNLKNAIKKEFKTERKKCSSFSVGSDLVKNDVDNANSESGGRNALDLPERFHETIHESSVKELDNEYSEYGSQMNFMFSSVPNDALKEQNLENVSDGVKSGEHIGPSRSSVRLGDVNHKNELKFSVVGKESHDDKLLTSLKKTKRTPESTSHVILPPLTRNRRKNLAFASPELLSYKRSRSGRLLVPPLDFWRNQQAVYNMDGQIAGVQDGLPAVETPTGSRSEPVRKKRKFI